jgi:anti-sigma regulatory factor (Ser/Thr protein kinase)/GNAT superfamily N-acetyltransferase
MMDGRQEYSDLALPNDPAYVEVACEYVRTIADKLGFDEDAARDIEIAVREAVTNVIEHAYEPGERASFQLSCEFIAPGLTIAVRDQGVPFDPSPLLLHSDAKNMNRDFTGEPGIQRMIECMDEVRFNNLGRKGKETLLTKYLNTSMISDHYNETELEPYPVGRPDASTVEHPRKCIVRRMRADEAVEVSRCAYKAYGYSYALEHVYFPERLVEMNRSGLLHSAVAVTEDGEIAGHCALIKFEPDEDYAELGQGFVKPEFRGRGCFRILNDYLVDQAKSQGLSGIYGQAVTNHTGSQKVARHLGLHDTAIKLGFLPTGTRFRGITEKLPQRDTLVLSFVYLEDPHEISIHPPPRHSEIILNLYKGVGQRPIAVTPEEAATAPTESESIIHTLTIKPLDLARIRIERYGANVFTEVKAGLRELCVRRFDVIHLYLNLFDPNTYHFAQQFEELGFFFAGILPGRSSGDELILQYLNNVSMDYEKIKVASERGQELLAYIREHDPNTF